jgi:hypothetical protein
VETLRKPLDEHNVKLDDLELTKAEKAELEALKLRNSVLEQRVQEQQEALVKANSGEATATKNGVGIVSLGKDVANAPLIPKVKGMTLNAEQLIPNGDFSTCQP